MIFLRIVLQINFLLLQLNLYHIFYTVAKCGNISTAAGQLFISQPAISKSISKLEQNLDTTLFLRSSRGVTLTLEGELLFKQVDAAFSAIEQIIGYRYELDDFQIQAVTEGTEAMGSALVKLRSDGKLYSGNGISTDIIGAGIRAYINAVNKIVYEEDAE